jgi:transposase
MRITNELVEKKYSEGLDHILDLFTQVASKIQSLENDNKTLRKSFSELKPNRSCPDCIVKQFDIDKLEEENKSLKRKLKYRQDQDYYGSSTPSSKKKFKEKSSEDNIKKKGGAKKGHKGHGRKIIKRSEADEIISLDIGDICPGCGNKTRYKGDRARFVIDIEPLELETKRRIYDLSEYYCPYCGKKVSGNIPGVLPNNQYGNKLLVHCIEMHYLHRMTIGTIENIWDVPHGIMINNFHKVAQILKPVADNLVPYLNNSIVKQADETSWRIDGQNGYIWTFLSDQVIIFRVRKTRASTVPNEIFGTEELKGYLVVDRYQGYNQIKILIQYCYEHLKREVVDLGKEFPDNKEVQAFVEDFTPLVVDAIKLRGKEIDDVEYYKQAKDLKKQLIKVVNADAQHLGIQRIQNIFRDNETRLYHWADNRKVPADNNASERALRGAAIARKISFGSGSKKGAETREIFMTILFTLRMYTKDIRLRLKSALDMYAVNNKVNLFPILFPELKQRKRGRPKTKAPPKETAPKN